MCWYDSYTQFAYTLRPRSKRHFGAGMLSNLGPVPNVPFTAIAGSVFSSGTALAAAAGRQRSCRHHEVLVGEDSDNQTRLPPKLICSSDFNLENVENKNVICVSFLRGLCSFRFAVSWIPFAVHCSCVFSHFNVNTTYVQVLEILRPTKRIYFI